MEKMRNFLSKSGHVPIIVGLYKTADYNNQHRPDIMFKFKINF